MKRISGYISELESIEEEERFIIEVLSDSVPSRRFNQELVEAAFAPYEGFKGMNIKVVKSYSMDLEKSFGQTYLLPHHALVIVFE